MLKETYTLTNGVEIPKIGYGTWKIANDQATEKVLEAIEAGYRHIDTAQAYGNEAGVGAAIKKQRYQEKSCSSPPKSKIMTVR